MYISISVCNFSLQLGFIWVQSVLFSVYFWILWERGELRFIFKIKVVFHYRDWVATKRATIVNPNIKSFLTKCKETTSHPVVKWQMSLVIKISCAETKVSTFLCVKPYKESISFKGFQAPDSIKSLMQFGASTVQQLECPISQIAFCTELPPSETLKVA